MQRRARVAKLSLLAFTTLLGVVALRADEITSITLTEYKIRRERSANREAYDRAVPRLSRVKLGMRSDEFFEKMEMLVIRDKNGKGIDGFCEGQLPQESIDMSKGKSPDHYIVFGWYENWKKSKGPAKKFFVVFRDNVLREIGFFDPRDDIGRIAGRMPE